MISLRTRGAAETEAFGARLATVVAAGDVILLLGGLGAGKTTLVRGLARGLGFAGGVTSPTFTLCHVYSGRLALVHADLWRLDSQNEVLDLGIEDEIEEGAAAVIEWGEAAPSALSQEALLVRIEAGLGPRGSVAGGDVGAGPSAGAGEAAEERFLSLELRGPWAARHEALATIAAEERG